MSSPAAVRLPLHPSPSSVGLAIHGSARLGVLTPPLSALRLSRRNLLCRAQAFDPSSVDVSQVRPQADRLLVRLDTPPKSTVGGVLLPAAAVKYDNYLTGEVVSAGPDAKSAAAGQKVMFSDLNAYEVSLGARDEKLCLVKDGDLLAVVE